MIVTKPHWHSMMVHTVAALLPFAAVAWLIDVSGVQIGQLTPGVWATLVKMSLVLAFVASIPSTITGIGERNQMYVTWTGSHRSKVVLSLILIAVVGAEIVVLFGFTGGGLPRWLVGFFVVGVNPGIALALGALGLKISLGRMSIGRPSYTPDMKKRPPVDILDTVAAAVNEPAKIIDLRPEESS